MPLQYTWRASKFFIFFIKVRAVDIVTLGTDFLKKKKILDFDSVGIRRQRLLRKHQLKSEFALLQTLSRSIGQMLANVFGVEF